MERTEGMANRTKTLREVCVAFGISRRVVQGYEQQGLVQASGRNLRGYLLYDVTAQEKIRQIRQLQKFGFQVKEIKVLLQLPQAEQRCRLIRQKAVLERQSTDLTEQLRQITEMIRQLE